ncbi:MAG: beta-1,6-N-acetylglucosaminyltransferase [Chthoniobacteraceae bacterium]|nr:beta-1,6-N-acetylglucosaminyltransferase [Chthoniobacteraceae bacterium]
MALAYCIVAYKNPGQIGRLLRSLAHPGNVCFVHYDKRSPRREHEALARLAADLPNVFPLPARPVLWGRFSIVATQLEAMRRGLAHPWSHFITLSGQDFPLLPQGEIVRELEALPGASFVGYFDPFAGIWKDAQERLTRVHLDSGWLEALLKLPGLGRRLRRLMGCEHSIPFVPLVRRKRPSWFRYMGGSNHLALSREAVEYTLGDPRARRIVRRLKSTGIPEESVFQSVLCNSPLAATLVNDDRRAIAWERPGAPSPRTLTLADLPWLRTQREAGKWFARKFDTAVDAAVLGALEKDLGL